MSGSYHKNSYLKGESRGYFGGLVAGVKSLAIGLRTTMREFFVPKITQQYPENRAELKMFDRFRGALVMPHDENNEHKCISCHLCEKACPNDTIKIVDEVVEVEGKKKKILGVYEYNLGKCMFCMLCTQVCPQDAIEFDQSFENAVFDRQVLNQRLNAEGSKCVEKKPVAKPVPTPPKSAAKPTEREEQTASPKTDAPLPSAVEKMEEPSSITAVAPATESPSSPSVEETTP